VVPGLKVPHAPVGAQLHVTPPFLLSFSTLATIPAVPPAIIAAGGGWTICTASDPLDAPGSLPIPLQAHNAAARVKMGKSRILWFIVHLGKKGMN